MPATALARQPDASTVPLPAKRVRIQPRIAKAVRLLLTGECKTQKAAAEQAGLNASYLCEALSKPKIQVFIAQETRRTISNGTMRASARLIELIDAASEHVSLDASRHVLAIEGIKPHESGTNISIINNVVPGYVIDMRDPREPAPTIDVVPESER
jgi:hypothetical protein